ncbi:MAG: hypothetical protein ACYCQJ_15885 [Nitrososphaerales archaeon]
MSFTYIAVQPYIRLNDTIYLLLGKRRAEGTWAAFGRNVLRKPISNDLEEAKKLIVQDLYRETMGILGKPSELEPFLRYYHLTGTRLTFFLEMEIACPEQFVDAFQRMADYFGKCRTWNDKRGIYELLGPCAQNSLKISELALVPINQVETLELQDSYQEEIKYLLQSLSSF